jgi:hypothetical protein
MKMYYKNFWLSIISFILVISVACNPKENDGEKTDKPENKPFAVADYNFSIKENNKFIPYNKAIYHRGDEVFLVLENVGPFMPDRDSLNHAEMKLVVTDAIGQIIVRRDSLFGERGHGKFKENMLTKPFGSFVSNMNNPPGKYSICLTVYDLVRRDSIVVCDDFFLE